MPKVARIACTWLDFARVAASSVQRRGVSTGATTRGTLALAVVTASRSTAMRAAGTSTPVPSNRSSMLIVPPDSRVVRLTTKPASRWSASAVPSSVKPRPPSGSFTRTCRSTPNGGGPATGMLVQSGRLRSGAKFSSPSAPPSARLRRRSSTLQLVLTTPSRARPHRRSRRPG
ncbi:hypothetical protein ACVOMT_16965 [Sphingomonas panni]